MDVLVPLEKYEKLEEAYAQGFSDAKEKAAKIAQSFEMAERIRALGRDK